MTETATREEQLELAIGRLLNVLDSIGGYLPADAQTSLREARRLITPEFIAEGTGTHPLLRKRERTGRLL